MSAESVIVQSAPPAHVLVRAIFHEHLSSAGKLQHTALGVVAFEFVLLHNPIPVINEGRDRHSQAKRMFLILKLFISIVR